MSSWPSLLQSPGVPSHTQVREPQSAMRRQEQPPVRGFWSPRSAMEAMIQSGQPRKSGKRGPMQPAPLTSGGLALEEITCREWGPHLQYSFLIKLASLSGKGPSVGGKPGTGADGWLIKRSSDLRIIWLTANGRLGRRLPGPMSQLEVGVRHGFEVSRFPDCWPPWEQEYPGGGAFGHVPLGPKRVESKYL